MLEPPLDSLPAAPSPREKRAVAVLLFAFLLAITLPYLLAATSTPQNPITPPGAHYAGLLYNADDQNVHLSWARQARDGHFVFRDLFTHESLQTRPLFTNVYCWLMGLLAHIMPLVVAYHVLRVICAGLALGWFWKLTTQVLPTARVRLTAVGLAAFAGGSGFLASVFPGITFIDRPDSSLMMPEAFTFASALIFSLNIAAMALLLAVYSAVLGGQKGPTTEVAGNQELSPPVGTADSVSAAGLVTAFFAALLLSNIHTYDVLPMGVALLGWMVYELWKEVTSGGRDIKFVVAPVVAALLGAVIPLLYQLVVFSGSEEFRVKALTKTPPPSFVHIALSYGPLLLLAVYGAVVGWKASRGVRLLTFWMVATLLMIYVPVSLVSFARKMIEGVHLPMCLLASLGLWAILERLPSRSLRPVLCGAFLLMMSASSLSFAAWCSGDAANNSAARRTPFLPPLYLPPGDVAALRWLDESPQERDRAVLCLVQLGNYVPRETGRTVYLGHWAETLHPNIKLGETARFYGLVGTPMTPDEARTWLRQNHIGFVVMGFYEHAEGGRLPLNLPVAHAEGGTEVYRVE